MKFSRLVMVFLVIALGIGYANKERLTHIVRPILLKTKMMWAPDKATSRLSLCYELDREKWVTFPIPTTFEQIKVLSNAYLLAESAQTDQKQWSYAIQYQFIYKDKPGPEETHTYHHVTKLTRYRVPDSPTETPLVTFPEKEFMPLDGRTMILNLGRIESPHTLSAIKIRMADTDPAVIGVVARTYVLEKTSEQKTGYLWNRLNKATKEKLSGGNVYPMEFLTETEKQNIVTKMWEPLGPHGLEGKDYYFRQLYTQREIEGAPVSDALYSNPGNEVSRTFRLTLPVQEPGETIRFVFSRPASQGADQPEDPATQPVHLTWHGNGRQKPLAASILLVNGTATYENKYNWGIIEIRSEQPTLVQMFRIIEDQAIQFWPEPVQVKSYVMDKDLPIVYTFFQPSERAFPFRVDFRSLFPFPEGQVSVEYEFMDSMGKTMNKGKIDLSPIPSVYDRVSAENLICSEPEKFYFMVFPGTDRVKFHAKTPLLICAYNRPPGFVKEIRVPEDYDPAKSREDETQPTWFSLSPPDFFEKSPGEQSVMVSIQKRPVQRDPRIDLGEYKWTSYTPEGDPNGRYLLVPRQTDQTARIQAVESVFHPLHRGTNKLVLEGLPIDQTLTPELVFIRSRDDHPLQISIAMDNSPYFTGEVVGRSGRFTLPNIIPGRHNLDLELSADDRCLINYSKSPSPGYLLRFATILNKTPLVYAYEKELAGEELISMLFFTLPGQKSPSILTAHLDKAPQKTPGILKQFTIARRRYHVQSDTAAISQVLNFRDQILDGGQLLFFPVGADLPQGKYTMTVALEKGSGGYLVFYKLLPGKFSEIAFKRGVAYFE